MIRSLLRSTTFIATAKKLVRKDPRLAFEIKEAMDLLAEDAFQARLKTHKLKGTLKGSLACSAGYDFRIIFKIVKYENSEAILLETLGNHDEVY